MGDKDYSGGLEMAKKKLKKGKKLHGSKSLAGKTFLKY